MIKQIRRAATLCVLVPFALAGQAKRPLVPGDIYRLKDVSPPVVSPDGQWVAYSVATSDSVKDKRNTDLKVSAVAIVRAE